MSSEPSQVVNERIDAALRVMKAKDAIDSLVITALRIKAERERDRLREVNAELLAALKSIIRLDDEGYPENNIDAGRRYRAAERDAWRAARAAIAKSEAAS